MSSGIQQSQSCLYKLNLSFFFKNSGQVQSLHSEHMCLSDVELLKLTGTSSNEKGWLCTSKHRSKMTKYKSIECHLASNCHQYEAQWSRKHSSFNKAFWVGERSPWEITRYSKGQCIRTTALQCSLYKALKHKIICSISFLSQQNSLYHDF